MMCQAASDPLNETPQSEGQPPGVVATPSPPPLHPGMLGIHRPWPLTLWIALHARLPSALAISQFTAGQPSSEPMLHHQDPDTTLQLLTLSYLARHGRYSNFPPKDPSVCGLRGCISSCLIVCPSSSLCPLSMAPIYHERIVTKSQWFIVRNKRGSWGIDPVTKGWGWG